MNNSDRRSMNKIILGGFISDCCPSCRGLVYAGRLDERVSNIEKITNQSSDLTEKVIINTVSIERITQSQRRVIETLDKINDRQRRIEIKLEQIIK